MSNHKGYNTKNCLHSQELLKALQNVRVSGPMTEIFHMRYV